MTKRVFRYLLFVPCYPVLRLLLWLFDEPMLSWAEFRQQLLR